MSHADEPRPTAVPGPSPRRALLFVYGTLLPDLAPERVRTLVRRCRRVGAATMAGRLYDLGRFPGAVFDGQAPGTIRGEVLELPDDETLAALDEYEGYMAAQAATSPFDRVRRACRLADGQTLTCWTYAYQGDVSRAAPVPEGDYRRWRDGAAPGPRHGRRSEEG